MCYATPGSPLTSCAVLHRSSTSPPSAWTGAKDSSGVPSIMPELLTIDDHTFSSKNVIFPILPLSSPSTANRFNRLSVKKHVPRRDSSDKQGSCSVVSEISRKVTIDC